MSDTSEPLVSVVMATYNTEYYMLREAIESVINQTYTNWELILIDDCSTKYNDFSFIDEYHDDRIHLYHNEENLGCTKCFNKGIRLSKGKYIARLDADDISLPKRLELQVKYMEKHKDIKVLSCRIALFGKSHGAVVLMPNNTEYLRAIMLFYNCIHHSSVLLRRSLFDVDNMYYDESFKYAQDYDLWVQIFKDGDYIRHLPKCLVLIRVHDSQISSSERKIEQEQFISRICKNQLRNIYKISDRDINVRNRLVDRSFSNDAITDKDINVWAHNVLERNREQNIYNQHYLKLAFASIYISFIRRNRSACSTAFVIKTMPIELFQTIIVLTYRKTLGFVYTLIYG